MHVGVDASLRATSSPALSGANGSQWLVENPSTSGGSTFTKSPRLELLVKCRRARIQAVATRNDNASVGRKKDKNEDWAEATAAVEQLSRELRLVQVIPRTRMVVTFTFCTHAIAVT